MQAQQVSQIAMKEKIKYNRELRMDQREAQKVKAA